MNPAENSFRTAVVGGFNRQDVLNYIESSARESKERVAALQKEAEEAKQAGEAARREADAAKGREDVLKRDLERLQKAGFRVKLDDSDNSPGWKFAEYEMKGVPVRVEIGPKDMEKEQCVIARRDTGEKITVALAELESAVKALLDHIHDNLYAMALENREDNTFDIQTPEEAKAIVEGKGGFLRSKWCGSLECELAMKERAGVSSRCMPLVQSGTEGTCPVCGRKCTTDIYWGVAY